MQIENNVRILFAKILTFLSPFCYQQKSNSVSENRDKVIDINTTIKLNRI